MIFYNSSTLFMKIMAQKLGYFMSIIGRIITYPLYRYFFLAIFTWLISQPVQAAVLVKNKMWPKNTTLVVVFLDGTNTQHALVKKYAPRWLDETSLSFKFFDGFEKGIKQSHIRVSFTSHNGSKLGDHGDYLSKQPTLLLNELNQSDLPEETQRRLILHEFGHALGFEHEYRNPNWPFGQQAIEEQIQNCIPRLQKLGYRAKEAEQKCIQINRLLNQELVHSTVYDEFSIMNYAQKVLLKDNSYKQISARSHLSILDKLAMRQWYGNISNTH